MSPASSLASRVNCPCCGYPTLSVRGVYDVCELCSWEDDGQDDQDAEEVYGGPNSGYSLADARKNFKRYRVMYSPDRLRYGASQLEYDTKGHLMDVFERLRSGAQVNQPEVQAEIERLEGVLRDELWRFLREHGGEDSDPIKPSGADD